METVGPEYQSRLDELAKQLVTPDRYGELALQLAGVLQLPLPEIARVYSLPSYRNGEAGSGA